MPLDPGSRDQFCGYARSLLRRLPELNDIEIDNEPNSKNFWRPQFGPDGRPASPAAYELLLARCYDLLHAERAEVNVVAFSTSNRGTDSPRGIAAGLSPGSFILGVGAAYRASGRSEPIFDTVSHHPYPLSSREPPGQHHLDPRVIGEGDWSRLMGVLYTAFSGTAQPIPGQCGIGRCVEIWYSEDGFQTEVEDEKAGLYSGAENAVTVPAESTGRDHGFQLGSALRIAFCQPFVGAFFNFELVDEARLSGWQSGLFWPDWTPKQSTADFASAVGAVTSGRVDCSHRRYSFEADDTAA